MKFKSVLHSVILRYMISYAAIMAVLFIGVGIYLNDNYVQITRENSVQNSMHQLNSIRYQHEEQLNNLISIGRQIGLSPYISSFKLKSDPMKAFHLLRQLVPYTVTNDFCYQLYLIFHEDDFIYSSATSANFETFLEKLMIMEDVSADTLREALRNQNNVVTIYPMQTIESVLTDVYRNRMVVVIVPVRIDSRFNVGNVMFLIRESTYLNILGYDSSEQRNSYIIYEGKILAKSATMDIDDSVVLAETAKRTDSFDQDVEFGKQQYLLTVQQSDQYNMEYVTLLPMETVWNSIASKQLGAGIFLLLLSIPCMILTLYFSTRHAKPIKELRYLFPAVTSGKDDFENIQSGIKALLGRNDDLNTKLNKSLPIQRSAFIRGFVKGRYQKRPDMISKAKELGLDLDKKFYLILLIGVPIGDEQQDRIIESVSALDADVSGFGTELVALEQYLFVFFADQHSAFESWLQKVHSTIKRDYVNSTIAVSGIYHNITNISAAYLEASAAYDNRFIMSNEQVLRFKDVSDVAKDIIPFTRSYLDGFRKALRSGNREELDKRITELMQYLRNTEMSLFAFRMIYNNIIAAMLDEQMEQHRKDVDVVEYYDIFSLSNCRSITDLDDLLRKLCRQILSGKRSETENGHPIIHEIAVYIQNHYTEPMLQIGAIADAFNISAASLSLGFKEEMGISPSDYLLLLRMEKAKEMLSESEFSVKEIGLAVGYLDASSFIRRFRQYIAMTPAQYRQMIFNRDK